MKIEEILAILKNLKKEIPPDKEWKALSQKDANAMYNYNQALKDVEKQIKHEMDKSEK